MLDEAMAMTAPRADRRAVRGDAAGRPYCVWAPAASRVDLVVDGAGAGREPMARATGGWWTSARAPVSGDRYGFVIDDDGPFPDPRSPFQPDGVHGLSEWVDQRAFAWSDALWQAPPLSNAVIYELHVGTFSETGTFTGAIAKIPYLVALGVTHVELMPVAEFSGNRGWGYDGVDLFAPHHTYGRPDDLKQLVEACHAAGLAVILDVVYNHLGPAGNYLPRFGPYFTSTHRTPWGDAVNFDDEGSDEVRRFVRDNAAMWVRDYHVDGLRLDAVHAMVDTSPTHLLADLAADAHALGASLGRRVVLIAESDLNDPKLVQSPDAGGYGLDAEWSDDFHHALHAVLTGERAGYYEDFGEMSQLATALAQPFVYTGTYSRHRQRAHGRPATGIPGDHFVVATQNHDQIGNRARGERLGHLTPVARIKIAAAWLLTSPFVPLIFQGEEWNASAPFLYFTAHTDPGLADAVREGRRREFAAFGWDPETIPDPQAEATFRASTLQWPEAGDGMHAEVLEWYRALIALRRDCRARIDDVPTVTARDGALVARRPGLVVACNLAGEAAVIEILGASRVLLASPADVEVIDGRVSLPAEGVVIAARA